MLHHRPAVALSALALALSACGLGERSDASKAIASFLGAAQREDRTAFEAGLDRPALRSDLRDQLAELGRSHGVDVDGGASEFALDRMVTPLSVGLTAAGAAPAWPAAPTAAQVVPRMKVRDRSHVCLEEAATLRCLLSFARRDGAWRLVGMAAAKLQPAAASPSRP